MSFTIENRSDFYRISIDIIYSFLIGISFLQLNDWVTPFYELFHNYDLILGIGLVYFIVISGWNGWHRSVMLQPHWRIYGTVRYGFDLLIMFVVYNLILVSSPSSKTMYWEIFLYLIPLLYIFYLAWDLVKYYELKKRRRGSSIRGVTITLVFGASSVGLAFLYLYLIQNQIWTWDLEANRISYDWYFIWVYIVHTSLYRWLKSVPERSPSRTH